MLENTKFTAKGIFEHSIDVFWKKFEEETEKYTIEEKDIIEEEVKRLLNEGF